MENQKWSSFLFNGFKAQAVDNEVYTIAKIYGNELLNI